MSQFIMLYFTSMLSMFRTLIHPSSGAATFLLYHHIDCSSFCVWWSFGVAGLGWYPCGRMKHSLPHGYHPNPATPKLHHTQKEEQTTNVVIQQKSRSSWWWINVRNMLSIEEVKYNLINCDIKLVPYSSTITTMHGPIYIRMNEWMSTLIMWVLNYWSHINWILHPFTFCVTPNLQTTIVTTPYLRTMQITLKNWKVPRNMM